jgi:hypothetical protein
MLTKILAFALIGESCAKSWRPNGVKKGHCPYAPGELISKVKEFKPHKLDGVWYSLWDEIDGNDDYVCMATKLKYEIEDAGTKETL